jgi:hypothetical protein
MTSAGAVALSGIGSMPTTYRRPPGARCCRSLEITERKVRYIYRYVKSMDALTYSE